MSGGRARSRKKSGKRRAEARRVRCAHARLPLLLLQLLLLLLLLLLLRHAEPLLLLLLWLQPQKWWHSGRTARIAAGLFRLRHRCRQLLLRCHRRRRWARRRRRNLEELSWYSGTLKLLQVARVVEFRSTFVRA